MQRVAIRRNFGADGAQLPTGRVVTWVTSRLFHVCTPFHRAVSWVQIVMAFMLSLSLLLGGQSAAVAQAWASEDRLVTIGVLTITSKEEAQARWNPTADFLSDRIDGTRFEIRPLYLQEVARAVRQDELHFVHLQPLQFVQLRADYRLEALATRVVNGAGSPSNRFGSAIVRLSERTEIRDLADLQGAFLALAAFIPVLTGLAMVLLRKQGR